MDENERLKRAADANVGLADPNEDLLLNPAAVVKHISAPTFSPDTTTKALPSSGLSPLIDTYNWNASATLRLQQAQDSRQTQAAKTATEFAGLKAKVIEQQADIARRDQRISKLLQSFDSV